MQQHEAACTDAASASTIDPRLILHALQSIQSDVSGMRTTLDSVDRQTSNNTQRLAAIEVLLRANSTTPAVSPATNSQSTAQYIAATLCRRECAAAAGVVSLLMLSPRLRRLLLGGLHSTPVALLVAAQLCSGSALLAYRGHELVDSLLLGSGMSHTAEERERAARRRQLCYLLLLATSAALPAKGVAHMLLPLLRGDATARRGMRSERIQG